MYSQQDNYGNRGQQNRDRNSQSNSAPIPQAVKINSFYLEDNKTIKPKLFDNTARSIADSLCMKDSFGKTIGVSSTQLRRIFDEVKRYDEILDSAKGTWEQEEPYIRMIKSKVSYSVARAIKQNKSVEFFYKNLQTFINEGIDLVKSAADYHIFVSLFEAAYGFYYEKAPK